jgi:ATP-dependent Zn protease
MAPAMEHCRRPWWKRPPVWFLGILVIVLVGAVVLEQTGKQAMMPYSTFLEQVEAGRIASVTFNGTEILARLKTPADHRASGSAAPADTIRSRVPDFGDPTLIAELRQQRVAIEVRSPSVWGWLLGRLPWPMLIIVGVVLVAAVVRLLSGGKAPSASATAMMAGHGMIGLLSGLFSGQRKADGPDAPGSDAPPGRR